MTELSEICNAFFVGFVVCFAPRRRRSPNLVQRTVSRKEENSDSLAFYDAMAT